MVSLLHLHVVTFLILYLNILIFSKHTTSTLASKYFFTNYIYHNHKRISCYLISYPFIIIAMYFIFADIIPVGTTFISSLYIYFLYEITSTRNITKKEEYVYWYKHNVTHSFSMHAHDLFKKDYNFLNERGNIITLFKFEIIFFICIVIESEAMHEAFQIFGKLK